MNVIDEPLALPKWTQSAGEELANSLSHGIGLIAGLVGNAGSTRGSVQPWQHPFFYRYDRFYGNDVAAVFRIDALPRLAANTREISFADI